jgi:hypothetical protein
MLVQLSCDVLIGCEGQNRSGTQLLQKMVSLVTNAYWLILTRKPCAR